MKIVHNPTDGATISEGFRAAGLGLAKPFKPGTQQYCEDDFADALVANYPFLQIVTAEEVKDLKKQAKQEPIVEEPVKEEVIEGIPVAEIVGISAVETEKSTEISDDLKGTDWYGEGVKEERSV